MIEWIPIFYLVVLGATGAGARITNVLGFVRIFDFLFDFCDISILLNVLRHIVRECPMARSTGTASVYTQGMMSIMSTGMQRLFVRSNFIRPHPSY